MRGQVPVATCIFLMLPGIGYKQDKMFTTVFRGAGLDTAAGITASNPSYLVGRPALNLNAELNGQMLAVDTSMVWSEAQ